MRCLAPQVLFCVKPYVMEVIRLLSFKEEKQGLEMHKFVATVHI